MLRKISKFHVAVLIAIAVGAALRWQGLAAESLWFDEACQVEWDKKPFLAFLGDRWDQVDPPLNEIIAWIYNNIGWALAPSIANEEWFFRIPTVVYGLLTIPLVAAAAATLFGESAGILASVLVACNPYHIRYSQEARMYSLMILFWAAAVFAAARILKNAPDAKCNKKNIWILALCAAGASYTHYYSFISIGVLAAASFLLWKKTRNDSYKYLLRGALIAIALVLPYLAAQAIYLKFTGHGTRPWLSGLGAPGWDSIVYSARAYSVDLLPAGMSAAGAPEIEQYLLFAGAGGLGLLVVLGLRRAGWILAALAFVPFAAVFIVSQVRPLYHPRYLLATFPALVLLASAARPRAAAFALAGAYAAICIFIAPRYRHFIEKPNYKEAGVVLAREFRPGDEVDVSFIDKLPLQYYTKLASGRSFGAPAAIEATSADRNTPPIPTAPKYKMRAIPAGARLFELDMLPPWSRLYTMDAKAIFNIRVGGYTAPPTHTLLYESAPFPYLRLWRSEAK